MLPMVLLTSLVCILLVAVALSVMHGRRQFSVFSPFGLFSISFSIVYFLIPAMQEITNARRSFIALDPPSREEVLLTLLLSLLYFASCFGGYNFVSPVCGSRLTLRLAATSHSPDEKGLVPVLGIIQATAAVAIVAVFGTMLLTNYSEFVADRIRITSGKGYFTDTILVGHTAVMLLAVPLIARRGAMRATQIIGVLYFVLVTAGLAIILGSRLNGLISIIYVSFAYLTMRRLRIRAVKLCLVTCAILALTVILGATRLAVLQQGVADFREVSNLDVASVSIPDEIVNNFGQSELLTYLLAHRRDWDLAEGQTYLAALVLPIPRALWANKPFGGGPRLANILDPKAYDYEGKYRSSLTTGCATEAYLNGGILGIILVAFIHGLFLSTIASYGAHARYRYEYVTYVLLTCCFGMDIVYGEFSGLIGRIGVLTVPLFGFCKLRNAFKAMGPRHKIQSSREWEPGAVSRLCTFRFPR